MPRTVTEYLDYARAAADMAERMQGEERERLMEIAQVWLKLAADRAKQIGEKKPDQ